MRRVASLRERERVANSNVPSSLKIQVENKASFSAGTRSLYLRHCSKASASWLFGENFGENILNSIICVVFVEGNETRDPLEEAFHVSEYFDRHEERAIQEYT